MLPGSGLNQKGSQMATTFMLVIIGGAILAFIAIIALIVATVVLIRARRATPIPLHPDRSVEGTVSSGDHPGVEPDAQPRSGRSADEGPSTNH